MRAFALALALAPWALLAAGAAAQNSTSSCAKGLYLVVARGTGEPKGAGDMGSLAERVAERVEGTEIEPLDYPATFTDPLYTDSEKAGVDAMQEIVKDYRRTCSGGKIAVMGYSQGGQVTTDAFCGGEGGLFSDAKALATSELGDSVVAIVLFGDPSHVANASYNKGTSKKDGYFNRTDISYCEKTYGTILRSYCDVGDVYCDSGEDSKVHGSYVETYGDEVVDFIVDQYEKSGSGSGSGSTTSAVSTPTQSSPGTPTTTGGSTAATTAAGNAGAVVSPGTALSVLFPAVIGVLQYLL